MDTVAVISHLRSGLETAASAALAGYDVVVVPMDAGPQAVRGQGATRPVRAECLREAVRELASRGVTGASHGPIHLDGLTPELGAIARMCIRPALEALRECSLVIDCSGLGDATARASLLRRLEAQMTYGAVLASTDPDFARLAAALVRPTQFLGLRLLDAGARLEPLETLDTAPGVLESMRLFCRSLERPLAVQTAA
jgi:hypothetical protein